MIAHCFVIIINSLDLITYLNKLLDDQAFHIWALSALSLFKVIPGLVKLNYSVVFQEGFMGVYFLNLLHI